MSCNQGFSESPVLIYAWLTPPPRRSQWPRGLRRRSAAARSLRLWVRIPPGAWMFVCCECYVLSGRGLCEGPITRQEKSYRLWCVVCDLETSWMRRPWPTGRLSLQKQTPTHYYETEALTVKSIRVAPQLLKPVCSVLGVPYEVKEINITPYDETTSVRPSVIYPTVWFPWNWHVSNLLKKKREFLWNLLRLLRGVNECICVVSIYGVSRGECVRLQENIPYVKVHRSNPKHLYPKLNGYGDNGQRKAWSSCGSTYCTC